MGFSIGDAGFVRNEETLEPSMYLNKYGGILSWLLEPYFSATACTWEFMMLRRVPKTVLFV